MSDADADVPEGKVAKTVASDMPARKPKNAMHSFFTAKPIQFGQNGSSSKPKARGKKTGKSEKAAGSATSTLSALGTSQSASVARSLRAQVQTGEFRPSAAKTQNFRQKILDLDRDATFEPMSKEVLCSTCKEWKKMKEPYNISRFEEHLERGCEPPPPPPPADAKVRTLDQFKLMPPPVKPKKVVPLKVSRPCPGLTAAYDEKVGKYLSRASSTGGGARSLEYYSKQFFKKKYNNLSDAEQQQVVAAQVHDRTWRNDVSPGIVASFATGENPCIKTVHVDADATVTPPCSSCQLVFTSKPYKNALNKPTPDSSNLRYVPLKH